MLKIANNLAGYSLAAGEPFILSVQLRDDKNAVLDHSTRKLILSFYDTERKAVDQIQGVLASDASGAFFRFVRDGRFSDGLFGKSLQVELAEQLLEGRDILASGPLTIDRSSGSIASFGSLIGRTEARAMIYFDDMNIVRSMEMSRLRYAGAAVSSAPSVQTPAAINSDGTPQVGEQLMGVDPVFRFASITRRRWLRGTTALATTNAYTPDQTGSIIWSVDGTGEDGSAIKSESTIVVAAATPTLTITGPLTYAASAAAGTLVANIGNVPAGATPTLSPNDGRLAIAGDATNGWKVVVGLTASSPGDIALAVAAAGANGASATVTVSAPVTGNVLPTAALDDKAFGRAGYSDAGIYGSGTTIPAGDWTMHLAVKLPYSNGAVSNANAYDTPIINMYTTVGSGYMNSQPNLSLNFMSSTSSVTTDPGRGALILSGKDDAGNWLTPQSNRVLNPYWGTSGANVQYISGPYQQTPESVGESIFVVKRGTRVQLWIVRPGSAAVLHDEVLNSNFGKMTASTTRIGIHPSGTRANSCTFQRFFVAAGAVDQKAMEAIAQGVDPRLYLAFDQATDRLSNWQATGDNADRVGSGLFNITGAGGTAPVYSVQTPLIPLTVTADMPRVFLESNAVKACSGPGINSDVYFEGTCSGLDDDIYLQVVDFTTKTTVVTPWAKVARSVNGKWAGTINGDLAKLQWYDLQIRKGTTGAVYTLNRRWGCGVVLDFIGQSLNEKKRMTTNTATTLSGANFVSFFSRAKSDSGSTQGILWRGWYTGKGSGFGEARIASIIADKLQRPVGSAMSAVEGSAMNAWQPGNTTGYEPMTDTWRRIRPSFVVFAQGHGNTGDNASVYRPKLQSMFDAMKTDFAWDWQFVMEPLCDNGALANNAGAFTGIRLVQQLWAEDNVTRKVSSIGNVNDLKLVDTVHATPDNAGMGKQAERIARQVNFLMGAETTSAIGPRATAVAISGANVDVTFVHNGGAALKAAQAGDLTGFEVALATDTGFANKLAVASATVLDATRVRIVLSAAPGAAVRVRYQWGNPGTTTTPLDANGYIAGVTNPLYDDRQPALNTTLGFPAMFTQADLISA